MSDICLFCRLLRGEIPSTRLYEDEHTVAFLDIGPLVKGHALVIPKRHVGSLAEISDEDLGRVMATARVIARAQLNGLKADGVNIFQANGAAAGQVVPHLHVHVVPRFEDDGHHWNWIPHSYAGPDEMKETGERIRNGMRA